MGVCATGTEAVVTIREKLAAAGPLELIADVGGYPLKVPANPAA